MNALEKSPMMSYERIRDRADNFDFLMCVGNGTVSALIRRGQRSAFRDIDYRLMASHVGLILRFAGSKRLLVYEAIESRGVSLSPLSDYVHNYQKSGKPYNGRLFLLRVPDIRSAWIQHVSQVTQGIYQPSWQTWDSMFDLIGSRYDIAKLTQIFLRRVNGIRRLAGNEEYICSELCYEMLKKIGYTMPLRVHEIPMPADFQILPDARAYEINLDGRT